MITLANVPGFVDVPMSQLDAEKYALGLHLQRSNENAKFGIVRPEFFQGVYTHGETVPLPASPVDGYPYSRDELVYVWTYRWTGPAWKWTSAKGSIWYFGTKVDQATGEVSSFVKYRESESAKYTETEDGVLMVTTIAIRRKNGLALPDPISFVDGPDSDYALDKPLRETPLKRLVGNCKAAALNCEAVYMGEFVHGQQIPAPVSPVDGYEYGYGQVKYVYSWRWTTQGDSFQDPVATTFLGIFQIGLNQLHRLACSIDGTGHVALTVEHYNDGIQSTNHGRISVVALCQRNAPTSATANSFTDISDETFASNKPLRDDALGLLAKNARFAACRPETFVGDYHHGQAVALPVSAIDGYAYSRDELFYLWEQADTSDPRTDIRIFALDTYVDPTGLVHNQILRLHDGGSVRATSDGRLRVWTVAMRGHVVDEHVPQDILEGGNASPEGQTLFNGGFDAWSTETQAVADGWKVCLAGSAGGNPSASKTVPGLTGGGAAQRLTVPAGSSLGIRSGKQAIQSGDRRYVGIKALGASASAGGCLKVRVTLANQDCHDFASFDLTADDVTGTSQRFDLWFKVPAKYDTTTTTGRGEAAIIGTLDFFPVWAFLDLVLDSPASSVSVDFDEAAWATQLSPALNQIAGGLAYFPAIHSTWTDTSVTFDLDFDIKLTDGSVLSASNKGSYTSSGLTAGVRYAFYLYFDLASGTFYLMQGGHGVNGWAFLESEATRDRAVAWAANGHLILTEGPIWVTTNSSPTDPPGGGFDGGDGGCHRSDVLCRERTKGVVRLDEVLPGDFLKGEDGWLRVLRADRLEHDNWIHLDLSNGIKDLPCTTGHTWTDVDGRDLRTWQLTLATALKTDTGVAVPTRLEAKRYDGQLVKIRLEAPHRYWVSVNGNAWVLSHNLGIDPAPIGGTY